MNRKTTPYKVKDSMSIEGSDSTSYGYSDASSSELGTNVTVAGYGVGFNIQQSSSGSNNASIANSMKRSTMSGKTVFKDADYTDNLDRNGVEYTDDTVNKIKRNIRTRKKISNTTKIGPNNGLARAGLFIGYTGVNLPPKN